MRKLVLVESDLDIDDALFGDTNASLSEVFGECSVSEPSPDDIRAAFIEQASLAELKDLIALGEAANDEKDRRLCQSLLPLPVELAARQPQGEFSGPDVDTQTGAGDVIRELFISRCMKDGTAGNARGLAGYAFLYHSAEDGVRRVLGALKIESLLDAPKEGTDAQAR